MISHRIHRWIDTGVTGYSIDLPRLTIFYKHSRIIKYNNYLISLML